MSLLISNLTTDSFSKESRALQICNLKLYLMEFATSRAGERGGRRPIGVPWLPIHRVEESENVDTIGSAIQIVCTDCPEPLY